MPQPDLLPCLFSGEAPDTKEHVIPRWLQKRFDLRDQYLLIPNGTHLKYRHATIPVVSAHNNAFSRIEQEIARGRYDPLSVYLWAMKIHLGLGYKHSVLKMDRSVPTGPTVFPRDSFSSQIALFREMYAVWKSGGQFAPTPPGSVFIVDSLMPGTFDFFHCYQSGAVAMNIGDHFILVLLWDQGDGMKSDILKLWQNHHVSSAKKGKNPSETRALTYLAHHVWACESAYWAFRRMRAFTLLRAHKQFILLSTEGSTITRPSEENEYKLFCRAFGLQILRYGGEVGHHYAPMDFENPGKDVPKNYYIPGLDVPEQENLKTPL